MTGHPPTPDTWQHRASFVDGARLGFGKACCPYHAHELVRSAVDEYEHLSYLAVADLLGYLEACGDHHISIGAMYRLLGWTWATLGPDSAMIE